MAQEKRNRLVEWLEIIRRQTPLLREHGKAWLEAVSEEPRLIWQTPVVRYTTYGLIALVSLWTITGFIDLWAPPSSQIRPIATTADFHVVCSDVTCGYHFVIHRPFGFDQFPVECPDCRRQTGVQARRCYSTTCRGRWAPPQPGDHELRCGVCGQLIQEPVP